MRTSQLLATICVLLALACVPTPLGPGATENEAETGSEAEGDGDGDGDPDSSDSGLLGDHPAAEEQCDPFAQDCPTGEKCVPASSAGGNSLDINKCVPVTGSSAPGEPCNHDGFPEATDDCDATGVCWALDAEGVGICHAFCTGSAEDPVCAEGSSCLLTASDALNLCVAVCDPVAQDCSPGLGCYWANAGFSCLGNQGAHIPLGELCGYINDCAFGLTCMAMEWVPDCEGPACCASFCDLNLGDAQCEAPGTACVALFEEGLAPPGYEHVGVCVAHEGGS
jgi:hypothetical protein